MLTIANHTFSSRLFTGTGKFARPDLMAAAIAASGSQLVTMAIKRLEPGKRHDDILSPLLALVGGGLYLVLGTSLVREVYMASWRNLETPCMRWTDEGYGYKAKPGYSIFRVRIRRGGRKRPPTAVSPPVSPRPPVSSASS